MKLYTAILLEIKEQKKFSAHQIKEGLRDKVNNNVLVLDDVGQVPHPVTGSLVADVQHGVVNDTVKDIYDTQILPLKRTFGAGYYVYELENAQNVQSLPKSVTIPTVYVRGIGGLSAKAAATITGSAVTPDVENKVKAYVENKKKSNMPATLRGIHSSLKKKGVKIVDISRVCGKLGYTVVTKTPAYQSEIK